MAGFQAESRIVRSVSSTAVAITQGRTTTCSPAEMFRSREKIGFTTAKVMESPRYPAKIPGTIPMAPMHSPSKKTEFRSCRRVAPTLESMPSWRSRSDTEMAKAL